MTVHRQCLYPIKKFAPAPQSPCETPELTYIDKIEGNSWVSEQTSAYLGSNLQMGYRLDMFPKTS